MCATAMYTTGFSVCGFHGLCTATPLLVSPWHSLPFSEVAVPKIPMWARGASSSVPFLWDLKRCTGLEERKQGQCRLWKCDRCIFSHSRSALTTRSYHTSALTRHWYHTRALTTHSYHTRTLTTHSHHTPALATHSYNTPALTETSYAKTKI